MKNILTIKTSIVASTVIFSIAAPLARDLAVTTPATDAGKPLRVWLDPDSRPLPFQSDEEVMDFLRTAEVVSREKTPQGVTRPVKVLLERNGVRAYAIFRAVDIYRREWHGERGMVRKNFRDCYRYELAAYELSRMLDLDRVPPVVLRKIDRQEGSLQIWVEGVFTGSDRIERDLAPPRNWHWNMQNQLLKVFDNLIFNDDRNEGNILIDPEWKLWWIDHTRAFRVFAQLPSPEKIEFCEESLYRRLVELDVDEARDRLDPYLTKQEISTLLKRRDALVKLVQERIDRYGERMVLFRFF